MKQLLFLSALLLAAVSTAAQQSHTLRSPDGNISVSVTLSDCIRYDISCQGVPLVQQGLLQLEVGKEVLGLKPKVVKSSTTAVDEQLRPVVPFKSSTIANRYNGLLLQFRGNFAVEFRAFDDGVAYRFITQRKGTMDITGERFEFNLPDSCLLHGQLAASFQTACEEPYQHLTPQQWAAATDKRTLLPLLIACSGGQKLLISEADLSDYPAMFLAPAAAGNRLTATFPKTPIEFGDAGDRHVSLLKEAPYIARTRGSRSFPWRYFVITTTDGQLLENTMTARLSQGCAIDDTSWIRPGVSTWDWWNGNGLFGPDVDFVAGCNTATAKYYIDFAAKIGASYILLDEGWAKDTRSPFTPNDRLLLQEVVSYGRQRNVGVLLWLPWLTVERNPDVFERLADWGIKGIKVDFMDRSDQWMVNFYQRVAEAAAQHKLVVDFHGSFKPSGLEYRYPNVLSYEGVRGMEHMQNCQPANTLYIPFIRNAVGPMDFTPGAMLTFQPEKYPNTRRPNASHLGTRAHQMAMFVLFESGLQMLADSPTRYQLEEDCARFMTGVPVTTDETVALAAAVGEYAVVAKRKGDKWYIGGITNGTERTLELPLHFLEQGWRYQMTAYEDGPNANRMATHYVKRQLTTTAEQTLTVHLARNGGYAAVLEKAEPDTRVTLAVTDEEVERSPEGPFEATWESIAAHYKTPEWFMDAKFGIFIHWGPYVVPATGSEWYPKHMYNGLKDAHRERWGRQSSFGYKEFIPMFRAERFDPQAWAALFREAGARYVIPTAEHHDGFAMYDSQLTEWNAVQKGPKRDIIGLLAEAVRAEGMKFGVSNHRVENWDFMYPSLPADSTDLFNPAYATLYGPPQRPTDQSAMGPVEGREGHHPQSVAFMNEWQVRVMELIDRYQPDLLYFDNGINYRSMDPWKLRIARYYYNAAHGWNKDVSIQSKSKAYLAGSIQDFERESRAPKYIYDRYWQVDDPIGHKFGYVEGLKLQSAEGIIRNLIDNIAANGNLCLNISPMSDGTIPDDQQATLRAIGRWLQTYGEAVYGTRAWHTYGEGNIRYTCRGAHTVFAFAKRWDGRHLTLASLKGATVQRVVSLADGRDVPFRQTDGGLLIQATGPATESAVAFRIELSPVPSR